MKSKLKLGLILFLIGFWGILTLLTTEVALNNIPQSLAEFSPFVIKLLSLISPTIMLLIAVIIGTSLYDKVGLEVPFINYLLKSDKNAIKFIDQLKYGIIGGVIGGLATIGVAMFFQSEIPQEFQNLNDNVKMSLLIRVFYGGITEEILLRFGFMTFVVWIVWVVTKKLNSTTYWLGIIFSTLIFACGHFPVVLSVLSSLSIPLLIYILLGNSIVGIIFGWLYWKKGLEAAFVAHMSTNIIIVIESLL